MPQEREETEVGGGLPGESEQERLNRNLAELLQELRVALPGIQVLFAFLLTVPFAQGFKEISEFEKKMYFGTLLATALSAALLIAPTAYHRVLFRQQEKASLVFVANRLAIAGIAVLALAMSSALLLITHLLFGTTAAVITTAAAVAVFAFLWALLPLRRRLKP
jgi:Family of unknown function (DUF6328)